MIINFNNFEENEQKLVDLVYNVAMRELNVPENMSLNLVMVEANEIKDLNKQFRQIDKVTDVLSFPMLDRLDELENEIDAELGDVNIGDIYICRKRAKEQADEYGHGYGRELCFLAVHGLLHLLGYDHIIEEEEKEMFTLQEEILKKANISR